MMDPLQVLLLLSGGLTAGFIAGISGLGGGVVFTPILLFHFRALGVADDALVPLTIGTSLLCTLIAAGASTAHQLKRDAVSRPVAVRVGITAAIGVLVVSRFVTTQPWFNEGAFRIVFALVLAAAGVRMARRQASASREQDEVGRRASGHTLAATGLASGGLSAAAGVGGGIILVPAYRKLLRLPMHVAVGTSSATIVLLTLVGVGSFASSGGIGPTPSSVGYVDVIRAAFLSLPAVVASRWGVAAGHRVNAASLQFGFAMVMIALAGWLLYGVLV